MRLELKIWRYDASTGERALRPHEVEVTKEAEDAWLELLATNTMSVFGEGLNSCTPGYYNNEGQPAGPAARWAVGYPAGALAFFQYLDEWRTRGDFEGLELRGPATPTDSSSG